MGKFTCYEADDYLSGALHSATMGAGAGGPLIPGTRYAYSVGSPSLGAWSSVRTFLAPASPDAGSLPYRIAVVGDLGQTENSAATLERMRAVSDFVDNNGILGGGGGGDGEEEEPTPPGHVLNVGDRVGERRRVRLRAPLQVSPAIMAAPSSTYDPAQHGASRWT